MKNTEKKSTSVKKKTQAKSTNQHKTNKNINFYGFFFLISKVYTTTKKEKGHPKKSDNLPFSFFLFLH